MSIVCSKVCGDRRNPRSIADHLGHPLNTAFGVESMRGVGNRISDHFQTIRAFLHTAGTLGYSSRSSQTAVVVAAKTDTGYCRTDWGQERLSALGYEIRGKRIELSWRALKNQLLERGGCPPDYIHAGRPTSPTSNWQLVPMNRTQLV